MSSCTQTKIGYVDVQEFYKDAKKMPVDKRQTIEQELQQENQMIQSRQQQFQLQLQQREIAEIEKLTKIIDSVVADYASKNSYCYLGTGQVLYGDQSVNLTESIINILNVDFESK